MSCLKLTYYENQSPLKVVHRKPVTNKKVVQWFISVDPMAEKRIWLSPYNYCQNNPILRIDPDGMLDDEYLFDEKGNHTGTVKQEGEHYGTIAGQKGETATHFKFADPINDPKAIDEGNITKVIVVDNKSMDKALDNSGVNDEKNQKNNVNFILKESDASNPEGSGKMDYLVTAKVKVNGKLEPIVRTNALYITKTKDGNYAHNSNNLGNFMWGAGARGLGFTRFGARLGAHANSLFDPHYNELDSKDDQLSIKLGYNWYKSLGK